MGVHVGHWTHRSGDRSTLSCTTLRCLSPLPLLSAVAFSYVVVTTRTCVCGVLLEHFPAKSGTAGPNRSISRILLVSAVLRAAGRLSRLLAVSRVLLFISSPLPLVRSLIVVAHELASSKALISRSILVQLPADAINHFDSSFHLLIAIHLLRTAVVSKTSAQDLLRQDDVLSVQLGGLLPQALLANRTLSSCQAGGTRCLSVS